MLNVAWRADTTSLGPTNLASSKGLAIARLDRTKRWLLSGLRDGKGLSSVLVKYVPTYRATGESLTTLCRARNQV